MARRMSVALTLDAVRARRKTVTRRHIGTWRNLAVDDELVLIEKGMGLPRGASQVVVATVRVVSVRDELLSELTAGEVVAEGFSLDEWTAASWAAWWLESHGYGRDADPTEVYCRRIEWRYLTVPCPNGCARFAGRVPGYTVGSGWPWVPCPTCSGEMMVPGTR